MEVKKEKKILKLEEGEIQALRDICLALLPFTPRAQRRLMGFVQDKIGEVESMNIFDEKGNLK